MAAAGPEPEVVHESIYGWYWAADLLQELGAHVHLAHALGNNWGNRLVRNDEATPRIWLPCWPPGASPRSQHHRGVLEQDAPLAVGVNAKPSAGIARR